MIQKGLLISAVPGCEERLGGGAWARGCRACASGGEARISGWGSIAPKFSVVTEHLSATKTNYYIDCSCCGVLQLSDSRPSVAAVVSAEDIIAQ